MDKFLESIEFEGAVYAITIHYLGEIDLQLILKTFVEYPTFSRVIIGHEKLANRPHLQICLVLKTPEHLGSRMPLRLYLKDKIAIENIAISEGRESKKLKKYVLKEGNWIQFGFNEDTLKKLQKTTFKKKDWLMGKLEELEVMYMADEIDEVEYSCRMDLYRSQCNQPRNKRFIENFVGARNIKKNGITKNLREEWEGYWRFNKI